MAIRAGKEIRKHSRDRTGAKARECLRTGDEQPGAAGAEQDGHEVSHPAAGGRSRGEERDPGGRGPYETFTVTPAGTRNFSEQLWPVSRQERC